LDEICRQIVAKAKAGDMTAAKIIVDKILPNAREVPLSIGLPPLNQVRDISAVARAILDAASKGQILPGEAASLAGVLATLSRAIETVELEERLAALEAHLAEGNP
jgi:hypothetical protein